jgi:hypothetical protein
MKADQHWWKETVCYEIFLRSFKDSDGNGTGDLRGILEKLDYLKGLGVGALWITPFFPSPLHDAGYDVADYDDVHPEFGTLADFDELVEEARPQAHPRSGPQPSLRRACLVQGVPALARRSQTRPLHLASRPGRARAQ